MGLFAAGGAAGFAAAARPVRWGLLGCAGLQAPPDAWPPSWCWTASWAAVAGAVHQPCSARLARSLHPTAALARLAGPGARAKRAMRASRRACAGVPGAARGVPDQRPPGRGPDAAGASRRQLAAVCVRPPGPCARPSLLSLVSELPHGQWGCRSWPLLATCSSSPPAGSPFSSAAEASRRCGQGCACEPAAPARPATVRRVTSKGSLTLQGGGRADRVRDAGPLRAHRAAAIRAGQPCPPRRASAERGDAHTQGPGVLAIGAVLPAPGRAGGHSWCRPAQGNYSAHIHVPDTYGVFKFVVDYHRPGFSHVFISEQVPVRPFRHDEFERLHRGRLPLLRQCGLAHGGLPHAGLCGCCIASERGQRASLALSGCQEQGRTTGVRAEVSAVRTEASLTGVVPHYTAVHLFSQPHRPAR